MAPTYCPILFLQKEPWLLSTTVGVCCHTPAQGTLTSLLRVPSVLVAVYLNWIHISQQRSSSTSTVSPISASSLRRGFINLRPGLIQEVASVYHRAMSLELHLGAVSCLHNWKDKQRLMGNRGCVFSVSRRPIPTLALIWDSCTCPWVDEGVRGSCTFITSVPPN